MSTAVSRQAARYRACSARRLDPANAGTASIKPASLTNGLVALTPAGDYQNQVGQVLGGLSGGAPTKPVLIASLQSALRLTALRDLQAIGVKVIVTPAAGGLIGVDADGVAWVDDGGDLEDRGGVSKKGGVLDWLVLPPEAGMLRLN